MQYYYNPEVRLLLIQQSDEMAEFLYNQNPDIWRLPVIGPRPPYYANPRYEPYYPIL